MGYQWKKNRRGKNNRKWRNSRFRSEAQGNPGIFSSELTDCREEERKGKEQKEIRKQEAGLWSTLTKSRSKPEYLRYKQEDKKTLLEKNKIFCLIPTHQIDGQNYLQKVCPFYHFISTLLFVSIVVKNVGIAELNI